MNTICKNLVQTRFGQSTPTYNSRALLQQQIATQLAECTLRYGPLHRILEVGCGTGFLTNSVLSIHNPSTYYLNDLATEMIEHTMNQLNSTESIKPVLLPGDAEVIDFPQNLDAVFSSSTIQWFNQPDLFFQKAATAMRKNGILAVSTFGTQNFVEIRTLTNRGLNYPESGQLKQIISRWFNIDIFHQETITQWFESAAEVLNHIKQTGVNCLHQPAMSAGAVRKFMNDYERNYANQAGQIP